jgi:ubiquinone/menaquinone biosynthesis C-methylase UbiE
MSELKAREPDYGNWVSKRIIYGSGGISAVLLGLSFLILSYVFGTVGIQFLILLILLVSSIAGASFSIIMSVYFVYARRKFSPRGGNVQAQIEEMVLSHLNWDGKGQALDIGCGNAPLTISMAKKFPKAHVTGIDYWGGNWEYSRSVCQRNAEIEGVARRVKFQKASASALPFEDESFDVAVSNLVFHEVKDAKDKRDVIREALRVVKKGGRFAFQDLFLRKKMCGEIGDLLKVIRSWGVRNIRFVDTSRSDFIPRSLKLSFMVGTIGILHGKK